LFISIFIVYLSIIIKTRQMKTRLMTNKQSDSFRLDIITKDNEIESHYFKTEKEAKDFQKFTGYLNNYKDFI